MRRRGWGREEGAAGSKGRGSEDVGEGCYGNGEGAG